MKFSGRTALVRSIIDRQLFRLTAMLFYALSTPQGLQAPCRQVPEV